VLWPSLDGTYLEGGDVSVLAHYQDMLERMDVYDEGREAPVRFREHAALSGKITFVGRGRKFEIWNAGAHEARRDALRETARVNRHRMKPA